MSKYQSNEISQEIQKLLGSYVEEVNQWVHFSQRASELNAERFVQVVVLGWLKAKTASLNELAHFAQDLKCDISASVLHERIDPEAVMLLAGVLRLALENLKQACPLPLTMLQRFEAIYVTDSTQVALPSTLAPIFSGNQDNSMLKLQVIWDYLNGNLAALEFQPGKSADQKCRLHVDHAQANSLHLFDLGYFKQEYLQQIAEQAAYFVCRYQAQTALYQPQTGRRFEVQRWLSSLKSNQADCQLLVGGRVQLPLRLVVRRIAPQAVEARRRKAKAKARKQGKSCSDRHLFLLGWDILLSNLAVQDWSLAQLFDLYPIRTQIEWVFRIWKTQMGLDAIGNWRVQRVLCQVYAHLIAAVLCHVLTARWRWQEREYSFLKCVQIIQARISDLMRCLARDGYGCVSWLRQLEQAFRHFAPKSKRRKIPSTTQVLYNWGLS